MLITKPKSFNILHWGFPDTESSRPGVRQSRGGGITGGGGGNTDKSVRASVLKPTPVIYMAFEKYDLFIYEGDSIYNEIPLITPPRHGLELYTIYGMKDQGFTFRMVHKTLFYHSYLFSYRL